MNITVYHFVIASLIALLSFIAGFFANLIAMRKMFVAKSTFDDFRKEMAETLVSTKAGFEKICDLKQARCLPMLEDIKSIKDDIRELFQEIRSIIRDQNHR